MKKMMLGLLVMSSGVLVGHEGYSEEYCYECDAEDTCSAEDQIEILMTRFTDAGIRRIYPETISRILFDTTPFYPVEFVCSLLVDAQFSIEELELLQTHFLDNENEIDAGDFYPSQAEKAALAQRLQSADIDAFFNTIEDCFYELIEKEMQKQGASLTQEVPVITIVEFAEEIGEKFGKSLASEESLKAAFEFCLGNGGTSPRVLLENALERAQFTQDELRLLNYIIRIIRLDLADKKNKAHSKRDGKKSLEKDILHDFFDGLTFEIWDCFLNRDSDLQTITPEQFEIGIKNVFTRACEMRLAQLKAAH